ncbi:MAG TPA: VWA domain-containing protein [Pyrinomonadaceae bacterium]|nr:VWA domain-containing protein [Pyrinomonadaceae bacterium]
MVSKRNLKNIFVIFVIGLFLAVSAKAQQPTPTPAPKEEVVDDTEVLRVTSNLVAVPVSVTNANGEPVKGLTATDFRLDEEGRLQKIEEIGSADQVPLEIALLFDVSSSVNKIFELQKEAAARFLQNVMKPEDRATIFLISNTPMQGQARQTAEITATKVRAIAPASVSTATAFYDTVTAAVQFLNKNAPARSRRVVLVLSDGEDNNSALTRKSETASILGRQINTLTQKDLNQRAALTAKAHTAGQAKVLRDLQNGDTVFYSINPSGPSVRLNIASQRAQTGMQKFADETGGTAFLPQFVSATETSYFTQRNTETLERIFRQISAELRAQYLLQYYSEGEFPTGRYVKLKVGLVNRPNLRIRARSGYFAKNQ